MPLGEAIFCAASIAFGALVGSGVIVSLIVTKLVADTSIQDKIGVPIVGTVTATTFFFILYLLRKK